MHFGITRSACALCLIILAAPASSHAEDTNYEHYVSDKNQIAIVEYFGEMGAFATFVNSGQRAGDSYLLPNYSISPKREICFPKFHGGNLLPQNFQQPNSSRVLDLAGHFGAELPIGAKAEINGSVKLVQKISGTLSAVMMESLGAVDENSISLERPCLYLKNIIKEHRPDSQHILIGDVYYVEGQMEITYELLISGNLQVETKNALANLLSRIGLRGFALEGNIQGKLQQISSTKHIMQQGVPAAFRPYYLNAIDLMKVYNLYLQTGLSRSLKSYVNNEVGLRAFLEKYPDLKRMAQTDLMELIATGKDLVAFDSGNKIHLAYLNFRADLAAAKRALNLPTISILKAS